jgi:hopene-associated glycosyltransferase HpnB
MEAGWIGMVNAIALTSLLAWVYLLFARGAFWRASERDHGAPPPAVWPDVIAVVPARDEAEGVAKAVKSLLRQEYQGRFAVVLVDDQSSDGTGDIARAAAAEVGATDRLLVVSGAPLPNGWTGKSWAMHQGAERAGGDKPEFLLFTDADIVYTTDVLRRQVSHAVANDLVLSSLMVKLRCVTFAERLLIPAFIFFFQMLYPFSWVNRRDGATAAAAGGSMLVRRATLEAAGGVGAIRGALIDDCALARLLKASGPIRLALTERVTSNRAYASIMDARGMIARSAYAQLRYSPVLLLGAIIGMALSYIAPVAMSLFAHDFALYCGLATWLIMALAFQPTLRLYRVSPLWGFALPVIALVYLGFTLDSAYQHSRGRGGYWKGRAQADVGLAR